MSTVISHPTISSIPDTEQQQKGMEACDCGCCFGSRALMLRRRIAEVNQKRDQFKADANVLTQNKSDTGARRALSVAGNTIAGIVVAFFPKCPVCWAGYMSLFGAVGLRSIPYTPQLLILFVAGMAANLYLQFRMSRRKKQMSAFIWNLIGVAIVLSGYFSGIRLLNYTGIVLLVVSSLAINLPWRLVGKAVLLR